MARLSGLVYCQCGAKCHSVKSENAKDSYRYYLCSKKTQYGECEHGGRRVREDAIVAVLQDRFAGLLKDKKGIMGRLLEMATTAARGNRHDAERIKGELAEVEGEQATLIDRLMDKAIPAAAKEAIGRKLAEVEERRNLLLAAIDGLREQATVDTEGLAEAIRETIEEARTVLSDTTDPAKFNRAVEEMFGPMEILADGSVQQKQIPPASAEGIGYIAGGGFEPPTCGL